MYISELITSSEYNSSGDEPDADSSSYKFGGETLSVAGGERFDPETEVSYNFGEITADFTAEDVLAQHVPFRY